jgi:Second Messenger Oligonucleotide or Dinucleotide Synthetase domain/Adenylyl/Guanylyl and SMODS C-terminal sensor domain
VKLVAHFDTFFDDVVNINDTRLNQLNDSVEALKTFIRGSSWKPRIRGFAPQGSWAHKTIIKPVAGRPFDADILVYIDPVKDWTAKSYIDELHNIFCQSGIYKDKMRRFSHCVTIEYAGERKIDVAPCVKDRQGWTNWEVCNRTADQFEKSNPLDYTNWLKDRNTWSGNNNLRKVTRLLKFLRDIKTTFTCQSFLLTTLLGYEIRQGDANSAEFEDVPSALKTIVGRMDDDLQRNEAKPTVTNPVLPSETISDLWTDDQYANFRNRLHTYRAWIDDAYDEPDRDESIRKWRRVFGDDFAKSVVVAEAARSAVSASLLSKATADGMSGGADLVALVGRFGARALPSNFDRQPHMQAPPWPVRGGLAYVQVSATLHSDEGGRMLRQISSLEPLKPNSSIKFDARTAVGMPFSSDFNVKWRITNTDEAARRHGGLRGGFYPSSSRSCRWESLKYRGVHMAEAFVIRRRDDVLVGKSPPFYVVIE